MNTTADALQNIRARAPAPGRDPSGCRMNSLGALESNPDQVAISPALRADAQALAERITPDEALWVSGFLAGWAKAASGTAKGAPPLADPAAECNPSIQRESAIRVLYGTETGHSAELAKNLHALFTRAGFRAACSDLADYKVHSLGKEKWVLVITSTHGDGDPPENARVFFEDLDSRRAPRLERLRYAVLGLGDSSYEHFCAAARLIDRRLNALGARAFLDRAECDIDYQEAAGRWFEEVFAKLREEASRTVPVRVDPAPNSATGSETDHKEAFEAPVIDNVRITGRGSSKRVHHIEFSLDGSGLRYLPGDALGILPRNCPDLVEQILARCGLHGDERLAGREHLRSLREMLLREYEISTSVAMRKGWRRTSTRPSETCSNRKDH